MNKHLHIVFCGMDGSGKTTLADFVMDWLKRQGYPAVFKHGHGYLVSQQSFGFSADSVTQWRGFLQLLVPFAYLDNLSTYVFSYLPALRSAALIADRYFYDKVVRMLYYGIINRQLAKIYLKLLPRPTVVFFLDTSEELAKKRKDEYKISELGEFRRWYKFVGEIVGADTIRTDVTLRKTQQQVLAILKKVI